MSKNESNKSYGDKISNLTDKSTEKKELRKVDSHIKIHILWLLILLNLSSINFIKQKLVLPLVLSISVFTKYNLESFP